MNIEENVKFYVCLWMLSYKYDIWQKSLEKGKPLTMVRKKEKASKNG